MYTIRFENISFSFKANIRLELTRPGPRGRDRPWQSKLTEAIGVQPADILGPGLREF